MRTSLSGTWRNETTLKEWAVLPGLGWVFKKITMEWWSTDEGFRHPIRIWNMIGCTQLFNSATSKNHSFEVHKHNKFKVAPKWSSTNCTVLSSPKSKSAQYWLYVCEHFVNCRLPISCATFDRRKPTCFAVRNVFQKCEFKFAHINGCWFHQHIANQEHNGMKWSQRPIEPVGVKGDPPMSLTFS